MSMTDEERNQILTEVQWEDIRNLRNAYLKNSDIKMLSDFPLTDSQKQDWVNYRQALRDLPDSITDPFNVTWPTPPE